jgi:hypothetical protein
MPGHVMNDLDYMEEEITFDIGDIQERIIRIRSECILDLDSMVVD